MKKVYILALSVILASGSNALIAETDSQDNPNNNKPQISQENQTANNANNISANTQDIDTCENLDDKYDTLVTNAENNGLEVKPLAKPSCLMSVARKLGVFFVLNPYIFVVNNYRITKDFVIKYATITWNTVVGTKPSCAKAIDGMPEK